MSHSTLDLVNSIITMAVIAVDLVAVTLALSRSLTLRLVIAAAAGGWVGVAVYLSAAGRLAYSPDSPAPLIGILFITPLLAAGVLALMSERVRASFLRIPLALLIGLNAMRMVGALFLLDFLAGSLRGPFPFFAGLGDIITGVLAIPLALGIARSGTIPASRIAGWNAFGTLDLIVAVFLGITSAAGSPLQLIHAGVGSEAMQHLPLSLVPTVLVPFYLLTHAVIAAQLRARSQAGHGKVSSSVAGELAID